MSLAVVPAQAIEAWCYVKNEDVVEAVPTGNAPMHLSDQQFIAC